MRYITIEGNSKRFSTIALGSTYFGTKITQKVAFSLLDEFANQGGTTIDTALVYGQENSSSLSESEKIIGKWLKSNNMYNQMAIITKGLHPDIKSGKSRISFKNMVSDLNYSFEALNSSAIDLWFFHRDDPSKNVQFFIDILSQIESMFPIATFGASNWNHKRIEDSHIYSYQNNLPVLKASEIHYSLATTDGKRMSDESLEFMDDCAYSWYTSHKTPLFAFSSQAKGFFSKGIEEGIDSLNEKIRTRYLSEENLNSLKRVEKLSKELMVSPAAIAISYITSSSFPSVAIIGPSKLSQLKDSLKWSDLVLNDDQRIRLQG